MKRITITLSIACIAFTAGAQINFPALYGNNSNLAGSRYMPAMIGMDRAGVQIDLVNLYAYAGNSTFNRSLSEDILNNPNPSNQTVDEVLAKIKDKNEAFVGVAAQPLNFSFKVGERLAFGFNWAERFETRLSFGGEFFRMMWQGNKPYAGEEVSLGPITANAVYMREVGITGAFKALESDELKLWVAARPKMMRGYLSLYAPDNDIRVFTEQNGKYIDLTFDYDLNTAFPGDGEDLNPFEAAGSGFGFDLGGNLQIGERLHASLNLVDIGGLKFTENATNFSSVQTIRYRGVEIDDIFTNAVIRDSVLFEELTAYTETNEDYTHPLPTKLVLQGAYRIPGTTAGGNEYYKHSFFFTIIQGLSKHSTFGTYNILSAGAATDLGGIFNVGGNLNLLNFNQLQFGAFIGARLAFIRLGVGTSNLVPLILPSSFSSDVNFTLGLSF